MESGSRQDNALKQESGVDQRFHEKLKDSRAGFGWSSRTSISLLALAAAAGLLVDTGPASAACTFDVTASAYLCSGVSDGLRDASLNNSKIQVPGDGRVNHFSDAFSIGANNIIDSSGSIDARDTAIDAAGNLIFNNTGTVSGRVGISVSAGDLELTNTRTIGSLFAPIEASGKVKITNSGSITGTGIYAGSLALHNSGSIAGPIASRTDLTITNDGSIVLGTRGVAGSIRSETIGNLINNGNIAAGTPPNALFATGQTGSLVNNGEITGVRIATGFLDPVSFSGSQANATFSLDNKGKITSSGILAAADGAKVTVTNSGTITNSASPDAFTPSPAGFSTVSAALNITNTGSIISESPNKLIDGGDVTILNKNKIIVNSTQAAISASKLTVTNTAVVESKKAGATIFQSSGDITVTNDGSITGLDNTTAIAAAGLANVTNKGVIQVGASTSIAIPNFAINLAGKSVVNNLGKISAGATAISVGNLSTVQNDGDIIVSGATFGAVKGTGLLTFVNNGQTTVTGAGAFGVSSTLGLEMTNNGSLSVTGTNATGISALGSATIVNNGKIQVAGETANGLVTRGTASIKNDGEIAAAAGTGIIAHSGLELENNGKISGKTGVMVIEGAGPAKIVNQGYIFGSGGVAISLTSAADELTLGSKSRIEGAIKLGGGGDTVNIALAPGRSRIIVFDDLTGATLNVSGSSRWQQIGNAVVSLDTTSLRMKQAGTADVRTSIGEILDGRVSRPLHDNDPGKGFYIQMFGGGSSYGATPMSTGFAARHAGLIGGLDASPIPNMIIGAFAGGAWSSASASGAMRKSG